MKTESSTPKGISLKDLLDISTFQEMTDNFTQLTGIGTAILERNGAVLAASGWRNICTDFHRKNPDTAARCLESDTILASQLAKGEEYNIYKCKNGLVDVAVPIIIENMHIGNLFIGQFFFEPPDIDFFARQADEFGFDKELYLDALSKVSVVSIEKVKKAMNFLTGLTAIVCNAAMDKNKLSDLNVHLEQRVQDRTAELQDEIIERKKVEGELLENKEHFKAMMHQSPSVIELYDSDGLQVEVNRAYEELWGFPASHTVNKFNVLKSQEVVDTGLIEYVNRAYAGKAVQVPIYSFDATGATEGKGKGRVRWLSTRIYPLKDGAGKVRNIVISHEDISEIKFAEEERVKLEAQLRQAHKMEAIGTLAGGIAHDFNNILAVILGYAELAKDTTSDLSPVKHQLEQVLKAGFRAKELVKQILDFSCKASQERGPVDIHLIIIEALKLLRSSIPTTIEIHQNIDPSCGSIQADPTQIHQVVMNLCTNAALAMDEGGGVLEVNLIGVEREAEDLLDAPDLKPGRYVQLSVNDSGTGIEKRHLDRIFDPYFTTREFGKGSGMGLSVVLGIVKSHDGMITVKTDPGEGTTFNVLFPRVASRRVEETEKAKTLPTGNEHVLVVDDEESMVDMTMRRLQHLGYKVTAKTSSKDALELFRSQPDAFDLVVTDQTMPEITGEQLSKELMAIRPDLPIILCTGYSSKMDSEKANNIGISAFVMKPVDKWELATTVRQVLDGEYLER